MNRSDSPRPSLARIAAGAGSFGPALLGQAGSFGALLVPILAQRLEAVALLVVVSALGGVAALLGSWSFAAVYPSLRTGVAARPAVAASLQGTAVIAVLLLVTAAALRPALPEAAVVVALSGLFAACQSAYLLVLGWWIRHEGVRRIGQVRLVYGLTNLVLAGVACLPAVPDAGLSVATSLSFAAAAGATLLRPRIARLLVATALRVPPVDSIRYAARQWRPAVAGLLAMAGLQGSAVIVVGFGELRQVWAVVLRISGGFGTIGVSVLGPRVQAPLARAVRRGDRATALAVSRSGLLAGLVLSLCSLAALAAAFDHTDVLGPLGGTDLVVLLLLTAFLVVTTTSMAPISANLVLLHRQQTNLVLNVIRVAVLLPALLVHRPLLSLAILVGAEGVLQIVQAVASFQAAAAVGRAAAGRDHSSTAIGSSGVR